MKGRALAVAAALGLAGLAGQWPAGVHADRDLPCFTVARTSFVRRVTAQGNLRAVKATPVTVPQFNGAYGSMKIVWLAPDGTSVAAGDVVARFDRSDADKQLREATADLESEQVRLRLAEIKAASDEAGHAAEVALARQQVERARQEQTRDPLLVSRKQMTALEIDERLAQARYEQAEWALPVKHRIARTEVALVAISSGRARLALERVRTALANLEIRAPGDGIFVLQRDDRGEALKPGARLWPDQPVGEIPRLDEMEAELFVPEVDADGLEVGQPADVVVDARPDIVFHGKIRLVDKLAKPRQPGVPAQYLSVVVALDRTDRAVMKPSQRVQGTLVLGRQDAIVVPRQAVFERDGKPIVYRRGDHGFAPVAVELGTATAARIVITRGLADGDVIAERDPTHSLELSTGNGSAAAPPQEAP